MIKLAFFAILAASVLSAQQVPHSDYFAYFGASVSGNQGKPAGLSGFGVKLTEKDYVTTETDLSLAMFRSGKLFDVNSFRVGAEHIIYETGPVIVTTKGTAGMATDNNGVIGGAFAGGGSVAVNLNRFVKRNVFFFGSGRVTKTSLGESTAVYSFGLLFPINKK